MITAATGRTVGSPTKRLTRMAAALLAAGALALTACAGPAAEPTGSGGAEPEQELEKLVAVTFLPLDSLTFTPEMVALAGGYFEKQGLDVQIQPVQGSAAAVQTVIGGAAPLTRVSTVDVMPGLEQGQPLKAIGTMTYESTLYIISNEKNPIESAKDMEGQTMGMGSIGGTSEKMLNMTLDDAGVPRESVTRQAVPVTGATYELVKQGTLAGYIVSMDTAFQIAKMNPDAVISQAGLDGTPDLQTWITTDSNLKDPAKTEQITKFLAAIKEATQWVIDDKENGFENVLTLLGESEFQISALKDEDVAIKSLTEYVDNSWVDPDGELGLLQLPDQRWVDAYDTYVKAGLLKGGADPESWLDSSVVPAD